MKYIIFIILTFFISGCDEFISGERYQKDYYIITGLLYENAPIQAMFIGKTLSPYGDSLSAMNVANAEVFIREYDNSGNQADSISLVYLEIENGIGVYLPEAPKIVLAGFRYELEARIDDEIVTAETVIPEPIELLPDSSAFTIDANAEDFPKLNYETADAEHPLVIRTINDEPVNLMFEFYCLEEFSDNPQYIYSFGDHTSPENEEEYENPTDGSPRRMDFYQNYLPVLNDDGQYIITERSYSGPIVFYGNYRITVYSISENYFNYLYKNDGYRYGGIENGFGYFGAVSGVSVYTEIVE